MGKQKSSDNIQLQIGMDVIGHTSFLQGLNLPIYVNSISENGELLPSEVAEMHIGEVNGEKVVLITPVVISI